MTLNHGTAERLPTNDTHRKVIYALGILCVLVLLALDLNRYVHNLPRRAGSINRWIPIAQSNDFGQELYRRHIDYLYPPIFLILIKPLAQVSMPWRALIFEGLKDISLIWSIFLAYRMARTCFRDFRLWMLALALLMTGRFIESDLSHGNVNLFVLLFVLAGCRLWQKDHGFWGGILLALAVSIKLTPALLLVYAGYKRQWALVVGSAVGLILFLLLLPVMYLGWTVNLESLYAWVQHVIVPFSTALNIDATRINQSLAAVLLRHLTTTPAMERPHLIYINWADLTRGQVAVIYKGCVLVLLAFAVWGTRGTILRKDTPRFALHLSIVLILMVLLSGYSWHAHYVYLLIPYLTLTAYIIQETRGKLKLVLCIALWLSFILGTLMTCGLGWYATILFDGYGVLTLAAMILLFMTVYLSRRYNLIEKAGSSAS